MPRDIRCIRKSGENQYLCRDFHNDVPFGQFEGKYNEIMLVDANVIADKNIQIFSIHDEYCISYIENNNHILQCSNSKDVIDYTAREKENLSFVREIEKYY